ncbi:uncharacterized protein LY79DRAFT_391257 [Colletotrichum navitas]|uniref:Uncharacterized protein n=1 Tax=Colletotrichum navitas TaxID=681940 RepID=A0AAD8PPJ3_9PEZI|nr:uncharacterized protein LY79DRAFT_391257 [Colletotrichum navitas]KAK1574045.1 hypothetical protein LY79DRAFT_391257 [Colletotrichum navitas]
MIGCCVVMRSGATRSVSCSVNDDLSLPQNEEAPHGRKYGFRNQITALVALHGGVRGWCCDGVSCRRSYCCTCMRFRARVMSGVHEYLAVERAGRQGKRLRGGCSSNVVSGRLDHCPSRHLL